MKKPYIIGAVILLVVIGGSFVVYEYSPKAKYQKGLHYYKEKNYKKALPLFEEAAKHNYAPAEEKLGHMYLKGWGVPQDTDKAVYWFKKAAEQGNAKAEVALGLIYLTTAYMNNLLGHMFQNGNGIAIATEDYPKALYWFKKAAEQGNAKGENYLGYIYEQGLGVPQDYNKAVYWYKKAAEQGYAKGERNLGYMYQYGLGVPKDYNKAMYWYKKAAEQGSATAKANLERLESEH
jgi:FOG: TPR repeat, SEL1 subfamily